MYITPSINLNNFNKEMNSSDSMYDILLENTQQVLDDAMVFQYEHLYLTEGVVKKVKKASKNFFATIISSVAKMIFYIENAIEKAYATASLKAARKKIEKNMEGFPEDYKGYILVNIDKLNDEFGKIYQETITKAKKIFDTDYQSIEKMEKDINEYKKACNKAEKWAESIYLDINSNSPSSKKYIRLGTLKEAKEMLDKMINGADESFSTLKDWASELDKWNAKVKALEIKKDIGGNAIINKKQGVIMKALSTVTKAIKRTLVKAITIIVFAFA